MKPGAPLKRYARLTTRTPLARTGDLTRGGRLPFRSKKTERVYREQRRPLVADLLERFPICQVQWDDGCTQLSVDVNELLSRGRGGSITDEANCCTACRHCHDALTTHPAEAEARGFLLKSGRPANALPRPGVSA